MPRLSQTPDDLFSAALSAFAFDGPLILGVSGGGDSMALLHLAVQHCKPCIRTVVTVNHQLRPEAAEEAAFVAGICTDWQLSHQSLSCSPADEGGNLQNAARSARRSLLGDVARPLGAGILLGHTLDDQAETVLMNALRGSGVDGLRGMQAETRIDGVPLLRPLLGIGREALRDYLRQHGVNWLEDPSNDDADYTRIRVRKLIHELDTEGLFRQRLADLSSRMSEAREVLEASARQSGALRYSPHGFAQLVSEKFASLPTETQLRLLAEALMRVGGQPYRPRLAALRRSLAAVLESQNTTLHGCVLRPDTGAGHIHIIRELRMVPEVIICEGSGLVWDQRFTVSGLWSGLRVGPGRDVPDWPDKLRPLPSMIRASIPAVYDDLSLVALPTAGWARPGYETIRAGFRSGKLGDVEDSY